MPERMTKKEINATISNINGALAVARWHVEKNEWPDAIVQLEGANVLVLLAKARVERYVEERP